MVRTGLCVHLLPVPGTHGLAVNQIEIAAGDPLFDLAAAVGAHFGVGGVILSGKEGECKGEKAKEPTQTVLPEGLRFAPVEMVGYPAQFRNEDFAH
jgi:hypothetical protein